MSALGFVYATRASLVLQKWTITYCGKKNFVFTYIAHTYKYICWHIHTYTHTNTSEWAKFCQRADLLQMTVSFCFFFFAYNVFLLSRLALCPLGWLMQCLRALLTHLLRRLRLDNHAVEESANSGRWQTILSISQSICADLFAPPFHPTIQPYFCLAISFRFACRAARLNDSWGSS